ncbi:hypothetical protein PF001_g21662 [Phytophthora fragariae]|uniref:Uncharacterized protein n=1 Tax=Phytophthora fragariae TaxID=53985 RepID=A0A6A4C6A2_9STRA|nr:hypothetical protein PF001_g21662 [Phytophthora fragariae]
MAKFSRVFPSAYLSPQCTAVAPYTPTAGPATSDVWCSDFAEHKALCKRVKQMRDLMAQEEHKIRNAEEDDWTPENAFEADVGDFWLIHMRTKLGVVVRVRRLQL